MPRLKELRNIWITEEEEKALRPVIEEKIKQLNDPRLKSTQCQFSDDEAEDLTRMCKRFIGNEDSDCTFDPLNSSNDAFYLSSRMGLSVNLGDFDSFESVRRWIVLQLKDREG